MHNYAKKRKQLVVERLESRRLLAVFNVDTLSDGPLTSLAGDGKLSLREAIEAANTNRSVDGSPAGSPDTGLGANDEININVPGTIRLAAGQLSVTSFLSIFGMGAGTTTIDAGGQSRVFEVSDLALLRLYGSKVTGGRATLQNSNGMGGGIYSPGAVDLFGVEIADNTSELDGGGIYVGPLTMVNSAIVGNSARCGGGMYGRLTWSLNNSTIAQNSANQGGGICTSDQSRVFLNNVTLVGNQATQGAAGILVTPGSNAVAVARNSLLMGNYLVSGSEANVGGTGSFSTNSNYNLFGSGPSGGLANGSNQNQLNVDWKTVLENDGTKITLKNNGGPTSSVAILRGSLADESGNPNFTSDYTTDQRGLERIVDNNNDGQAVVDRGAIELDSNVRISIVGSSVSESGGGLSFQVKAATRPAVGQSVTVNFATQTSGTATAGVDFTPQNLTVTFDSSSPLTQVITVPVIADNLVEPNETVIATISSATGTAVIVNGAGTATGTITSDDIGGIQIDKTQITTAENGSRSDALTIVLTAPPEKETRVGLFPKDVRYFTEFAFDKTILTFTPSNWNVPQTINITGVDDLVDDGDVTVPHEVLASSSYPISSPPQLQITSLNDDRRGVLVSPVSRNTSEAGTIATFTVVLQAMPFAEDPTTIPLSSSDTSEGTVSPASLKFDRTTWNIPQTVTVTGVDDSLTDGNVAYSILLGIVQTTGPDYRDFDPPDVQLLNLDDETPTLDFGDAPSSAQSGFAASYPTRLADDGARHVASDLYFGSLVDAEFDGQPSNDASTGGDDSAGSDDEDGIYLLSDIVSSPSGTNVFAVAVSVHGTGKVDAWFDFNRDGDWSDLREQLLTSAAVVAGWNIFSLNVPAGLNAGSSFARFRLSSSGGLTPQGQASDGEVEDVSWPIINSSTATANVRLPFASDVLVKGESGRIVVQRDGQVLFNAPSMNVHITGSPEVDTISAEYSQTVPLNSLLSFDGGSGADTLKLLGGGWTIDWTGANAGRVGDIEVFDVDGTGANTLLISKACVQNAAGTNPLRVHQGKDDVVNYGSGWQNKSPQIVDGIFLHLLQQGSSTVQVDTATAYRNPLNNLDVNGDGFVSSIDALLIVNMLNSPGDKSLPSPTDLNTARFEFVDTSGDRFVSAIDALLVINALNAKV